VGLALNNNHSPTHSKYLYLKWLRIASFLHRCFHYLISDKSFFPNLTKWVAWWENIYAKRKRFLVIWDINILNEWVSDCCLTPILQFSGKFTLVLLVGSVVLIFVVFCAMLKRFVFYLSSSCVFCAQCCQCLWKVLSIYSNFPEISWRKQVNFQWDDGEISFVLEQRAQLDLDSASSLK
jgi:hypothetical protein